MGYLHGVAHDVLALVRTNRGWMGWNLILAVIPAGFALGLFPHRGRRSLPWWGGVAAFAVFLPNAPYVVTDLIHIRHDIDRTTGHSVVLAGVLPLYAAFILIGYLAYIASMDLIIKEVRLTHLTMPRWLIVGSVHAACSVGIVLGRVSRLNSWDTITSPRTTVERTFTALAWKGAPLTLIAVFTAVAITYWVVRTLAVGAARGVTQVGRMLGLGTEPPEPA